MRAPAAVRGRLAPRPGALAAKTAPRAFTVAADLTAAQVTLSGPATGSAGSAYLTPVPGVTLAFDRSGGWLSGLTVLLSPGGCTASDEALGWIAAVLGAAAAAAVAAAPRGARPPLALRARPRALRAASRLARLDAARVTSPVPALPLWDAEAAALAAIAGAARTARVPRAHGPAAGPAGAGAGDRAAVRRLLAAGQPGPRAVGPGLAAQEEGPRLEAFLDVGLVPPGVFRPGLWPEADLLLRAGPDGAPLVTAEAPLLPGTAAADLAGCRARLVDASRRQVLATAPLQLSVPPPTAPGDTAGAGPRARAALPVTAEVRALIRAGRVWAEITADELGPADGTRLRHIRRALRWADAALRAESRPDGLAAGLTDCEWAGLAALAWDRCRADWEAAGRPVRGALAATRGAAARPHPFLAEALGDFPLEGRADRAVLR